MDAVQVEEMLNYFSYDYAQPDGRDTPFAVTTELAVTVESDLRLVQIGIKGYELAVEEIPQPTSCSWLMSRGPCANPTGLVY